MTILGLRRHSRGLGLSPHRRRAGSAAPPGIVQDGLVAEWRFDDGSGTTLTDYSGNGRHGELQGGTETPTWTAQGLSFDGGDGVFLNSIPAVHGIDLVFRPGSPISRGIGRQDVLGQGIDNGLAFGDCVLDFADEIMTLLETLNRTQRQTFVIVTHDGAIGTRCHRIVHMRDGLIVGESTGLVLDDWQRARTDRVWIREWAPLVSAG